MAFGGEREALTGEFGALFEVGGQKVAALVRLGLVGGGHDGPADAHRDCDQSGEKDGNACARSPRRRAREGGAIPPPHLAADLPFELLDELIIGLVFVRHLRFLP